MDRERYNHLVACQEKVNDLRLRIKKLKWPHNHLLALRRERIESDIFSAAKHDIYSVPEDEITSLTSLVDELENANK